MSDERHDPLEDTPPVVGSGDFLADMGHADPAEFRLKAHLANQVVLVMEERRLSPADVAGITGLAVPDVSRMIDAKLREQSVWRLMSALRALGLRMVLTIETPDGASPPLHVPI